ncbi:MAG: GNAT family N-acetyltransferase [Anaerolineales bacterium]|nr:GNAT family N-acetyltransferase [Anaerolineales bacterium]
MLSSPNIRSATPEDAETLTSLTNAAYEKYIPLLGRPPQPMTADYREMATNHPVWLLEWEGQPAGLLVLIPHPDHLLIYSIAIHPDYQRRGLGKTLLAWAEEQARQANLDEIRLYTNEKMAANIALYQRVGYEITAREAYLGGVLVHMAKRL